jgi:myb proto-oncogene protein
LKNAVHKHGGKNWEKIAALVPGRTRSQCLYRWHDALDPSVDRANGRTGTWEDDEDTILKDAFRAHGAKNWEKIAALVPGRTQKQCINRWHHYLDPSIDRTPGCSGKWTTGEDTKLKAAVKMHCGKNWDAIAALVPGRTVIQCQRRFRYALA